MKKGIKFTKISTDFRAKVKLARKRASSPDDLNEKNSTSLEPRLNQ